MAGGRWAEESEQETPYDGGEDEGRSEGWHKKLLGRVDAGLWKERESVTKRERERVC